MRRTVLTALSMFILISGLLAQQAPIAGNATPTTVPRLIKFSGSATNTSLGGKAGVIGITFSIYRDQTGGSPLWMETQNVRVDAAGHYTVSLGASASEGLPVEIFRSGEAQWLGVKVEGQPDEQSRILLLSVPYALKASDAETIGGLPASAFVLAVPGVNSNSTASTGPSPSSLVAPVLPDLGGSGTANFVPLWTPDGNTLGNSVLFQSGTGASAKIGINTTTPTSTLDVKGAATVRGLFSLPSSGVANAGGGKNSQPQNIGASVFNSGTGTAVAQTFRLQAEPVGNNTSGATGSLNLLYGSGTNQPTETGFKFGANGQITFAAGQTFPGAGTITGVTAGSGLSGGGTSGNVSLSLLTTCSNGQILKWNGTAWACSTPSAGTVTSVGMSAPSTDFTVSGSPVTSSGTLGLNWTVAPTSANTANAIVKRDATGSFNVNSVTGTGTFTTNTGNVNGMLATSSNSGAVALQATATATSGTPVGILGITASPTSNAVGVWGQASSSSPSAGFTEGVVGTTNSPLGIGVIGWQGSTTATLGSKIGQFSAGAWGDNRTVGVAATSDNGNALVAFNNAAYNPTVYVENNDPSGGIHLITNSPNLGSEGCTIVGNGDLFCSGIISGSAKFFRIDHPLDPADKYLLHTSVESPDMKNVYDGVIALDASGRAWVSLPPYFEALNGNFRYQLTPIGAPAPNLHIAAEVSNNQFQIAGGQPGMKVSWQVTGIRHDAWAKTQPTTVEVDKTAEERGHYLHPQAFGQPAAMSVRAVQVARMQAQLRVQEANSKGTGQLVRTPASK